jgi:PleD family two-component response regulator
MTPWRSSGDALALASAADCCRDVRIITQTVRKPTSLALPSESMNDMTKPENLKRARILIVDDCPDGAGLLAELLALDGYHCIHCTTDAAVVVDLHEVNDYDLILLDLHLPFISGLKVMAQMRKLAPDRFLPVIVLTGDDNLRLPALEAGAYDFIVKPFDVMDLTLRVQCMLEVRLHHRHLDKPERRRTQVHKAPRDPRSLPDPDLSTDRISIATGHAKDTVTPTGRRPERAL